MSTPTIIAIDPGASGGIAVHKSGQTSAIPMPETRGDCIASIRPLVGGDGTRSYLPPVVAYIEKIQGFIPDGGASQMFEFGRAVERMGCILETLGVRLIEVTPQTWQAGLNLGKIGKVAVPRCPALRIPKNASPIQKRDLKAEHAVIKRKFEAENGPAIKAAKATNARLKGEWKNKLLGEAQRRFPGVHVTLKTADALLILDYARIQEAPRP